MWKQKYHNIDQLQNQIMMIQHQINYIMTNQCYHNYIVYAELSQLHILLNVLQQQLEQIQSTKTKQRNKKSSIQLDQLRNKDRSLSLERDYNREELSTQTETLQVEDNNSTYVTKNYGCKLKSLLCTLGNIIHKENNNIVDKNDPSKITLINIIIKKCQSKEYTLTYDEITKLNIPNEEIQERLRSLKTEYKNTHTKEYNELLSKLVKLNDIDDITDIILEKYKRVNYNVYFLPKSTKNTYKILDLINKLNVILTTKDQYNDDAKEKLLSDIIKKCQMNEYTRYYNSMINPNMSIEQQQDMIKVLKVELENNKNIKHKKILDEMMQYNTINEIITSLEKKFTNIKLS